jgi:two-component system, OmpR family, sensor kinase
MQLDHPHTLRWVDVDAELLRIVRRWEPTAERRWEVDSAIGYAFLNPDRLEAALDSLLENAVKFTRSADSIRVTGEHSASGWAVHVRDSGCGISAETANRLMQSIPGQMTRTGTGLGLAIVRAVVEPLGGLLVIRGEPGVGTLVTMQFARPATGHRNSPRPEVVDRGTGPLTGQRSAPTGTEIRDGGPALPTG